MTTVDFAVLDVRPEPYAASPSLAVRLHVAEHSGEPVHAMALRCQVRIEPRRRGYSDAEKTDLGDLFGPAARWGQTVRPLLWTQASTMVPGFSGAVEVDLPVPCSYDFDVAASKYLHALDDGDVPLSFLFSGTVFTRGRSGFCVEQIPWNLEAGYRMPVKVWRDLMDAFFPNSGWIRMDRESVERLARFRTERGLIGWDEVVAALLAESDGTGAGTGGAAARGAGRGTDAKAAGTAGGGGAGPTGAIAGEPDVVAAARTLSCIEGLEPIR